MEPFSEHEQARYWIRQLGLVQHPEGGFYRETYRDAQTVERCSTQSEPRVARSASTAIYFLLDGQQFSAFHRIQSDELWHFYRGSALIVHIIEPAGTYRNLLIGADAEAGQKFQAAVPAGCWFASEVLDQSGFALVGCTVAPGFEFSEFELAKKQELATTYPQHRALIERLTRA